MDGSSQFDGAAPHDAFLVPADASNTAQHVHLSIREIPPCPTNTAFGRRLTEATSDRRVTWRAAVLAEPRRTLKLIFAFVSDEREGETLMREREMPEEGELGGKGNHAVTCQLSNTIT
jgi:hypothetical protein